jgi:hypothetical protein
MASSLEAQVAVLTERLGKAEEVIGYLLQVVNELRSERKPGDGSTPHYHSAGEKQATTAFDATSAAAPIETKSQSNGKGSISTVSTGVTQLWDNMELDWDDLGLFDEAEPVATKESTPEISEAGLTNDEETVGRLVLPYMHTRTLEYNLVLFTEYLLDLLFSHHFHSNTKGRRAPRSTRVTRAVEQTSIAIRVSPRTSK